MEKYLNGLVGIRGLPIDNAILHDEHFLNSKDALDWNDLKNPKDDDENIEIERLPKVLKDGLKGLFLKNHYSVENIQFSEFELNAINVCKMILASYFISNLSANLDISFSAIEYSTVDPVKPLLFTPINNQKPLWLKQVMRDNTTISENTSYSLITKTFTPPAYNKESNHILSDLKLIYLDSIKIAPPAMVRMPIEDARRLIFKISSDDRKTQKKDAIDFLYDTNVKVISPINKNKYLKSKEINQKKLKIDQTILFGNSLINSIIRDRHKIKKPLISDKIPFSIYEDTDGELKNIDMIHLNESYRIEESWGNRI